MARPRKNEQETALVADRNVGVSSVIGKGVRLNSVDEKQAEKDLDEIKLLLCGLDEASRKIDELADEFELNPMTVRHHIVRCPNCGNEKSLNFRINDLNKPSKYMIDCLSEENTREIEALDEIRRLKSIIEKTGEKVKDIRPLFWKNPNNSDLRMECLCKWKEAERKLMGLRHLSYTNSYSAIKGGCGESFIVSLECEIKIKTYATVVVESSNLKEGKL